MRGFQKLLEVRHGAVVGVHGTVVADVIAVVAERRAKEGQEPETVDAQLLEVVELARETGKIADAVVVAVPEGTNVELVEDGVLVPEGVAHVRSRRSTGNRVRGGASARRGRCARERPWGREPRCARPPVPARGHP